MRGVIAALWPLLRSVFHPQALDLRCQHAVNHYVTFVYDQLADGVAFRGGVLGMAAYVEIQASAVDEKDVGATSPRHDSTKQIPRHLVRAESTLAAGGAGNPVLVLQSEDAPFHGFTVPAEPAR